MEDNQTLWRFLDGSSSVSASMLLAVLINRCGVCGESWGIRWVKDLTEQEAGVIIVATMLVFPTTLLIYGGAKLVFAAKQAADRKLREDRKRVREEGRTQGHTEERNRIREELERNGKLTPELARILGGEDDEAGNRS